MKRQTEPTLMYMFRYFCGVAVAYFAILWIYAIISTGWLWKTQIQFWSSFTFYGLLLGYLSWRWLERRLRNLYLPMGLALAAIFPVVSSLFSQLGPGQNEVLNVISRSWLWLPVLFVPLVLIAWQYNFRSVMVFIIFPCSRIAWIHAAVTCSDVLAVSFLMMTKPVFRSTSVTMQCRLSGPTTVSPSQ